MRPHRPIPGAVLALSLGIAAVVAVAAPATVSAAPPVELACIPGTGAWLGGTEESPTPSLHAALCARPGATCPDFASFDFAADGAAKALVAHTPPRYDTCKLAAVGVLGTFVLYENGERLIAVDSASLRVVADLEFPTVERSAFDGARAALTSGGRLLVLTAADGELTTLLATKTAAPSAILWLPERLVLVQPRTITSWPVPANGGIGEAVQFRADQDIAPGTWAIDASAVLRVVDGGRALLWEPFDGSAPRMLPLGPGERVLELAASANAAAALTTDGVMARIVARDLDGLRDRIVLQTWALVEEDLLGADGKPRPLIVGGDRWLMLDGGARFTRVVPVNTEDLAVWKQARAFDYDIKGHTIAVTRDLMLAVHPTSRYALSVWTVPTGHRRRRLSAETLEKTLGGRPVAAEVLDRRRFLLRDEAGHAAVFNARDGGLESVVPPEVDAATTGPLERIRDAGFVVPELAPTMAGETQATSARVQRWHVLSLSGKRRILEPNAIIVDALSPRERWFGYCLPKEPCELELPRYARLEGSLAELTALPVVAVDRTLGLSWLSTIASLLLLVGVPLWRRGTFQRASKEIRTDQSPLVTGRVALQAQLLFDARGRRTPGPFDRKDYVHRSLLTRWPFRSGGSLAIGALIAAPLTLERIQGEPAWVGLPVFLGVALPLMAICWVLSSWNVWNRLYLFRFGLAVEGLWREVGARRFACYTASDGKIYQLQRADPTHAFPLVLFRPRKPWHAGHYTGPTDLAARPAPQTLPEDVKIAGVGSSHALPLLGAVLGGALVVLTLGLVGFGSAFPEPVPESRLLELAGSAQDWSMLEGCLAYCGEVGDDDRAACQLQCRRRQLRLVLALGGVELAGDPEPIAADVRTAQAERWEALVEAVEAGAKGKACGAMSQPFERAQVWTSPVQEAFARVYGRSAVLAEDEALAEAEARVVALDERFFAPLCRPSESCRVSLEACPEPPPCSGSAASLRAAICALAPAAAPLTSR